MKRNADAGSRETHVDARAGAQTRPLAAVNRVVIKVGSNLLARAEAGLDESQIARISETLASLVARRVQPILVSSGAIACGLELLSIRERPRDLSLLQAAASVGQSKLMESYSRALEKYGLIPGQVLLTQADFVSRQAYLSARRTLEKMIELGVIPIINENDATAVEEIRFGDNDTLAALVSVLVRADVLFLLSDVDGFYSDLRDPSTLVPLVEEITPDIEKKAGRAGSQYGSGGMMAKVRAARIATMGGVETFILNGRAPHRVIDVLDGHHHGTRFVARPGIRSRKHWIAFALPPKGRIVIDAGARRALVEQKKSLLPAGVLAVEGCFDAGDAVSIVDESGTEIARGIAEYSHIEVAQARGKSTSELASAGLSGLPPEVVHRDHLVILVREKNSEKGETQ